MRKQFKPVSTQGTLGASFWVTAMMPEFARDGVSVFLVPPDSRHPQPHFNVMIEATSPFNVPALAAKGLAELIEEEAEYRRKALQMIG